MHIGLSELIVIVLVAVCIISPQKASAFAKSFGEKFREVKRATKEFTDAKDEVVEQAKEINEAIHGTEQ